MNVESSRSHLIVSIKVESKNLTNGSVSTGKLSLVDLAGSERAAKTGAKDHKLKVCTLFTLFTVLCLLHVCNVFCHPHLCRRLTL